MEQESKLCLSLIASCGIAEGSNSRHSRFFQPPVSRRRSHKTRPLRLLLRSSDQKWLECASGSTLNTFCNAQEREGALRKTFLPAAFCRHETFFCLVPLLSACECGPWAGWVFWVFRLLIYYHFTQRRLHCLHVHRVRFIFTNAPGECVWKLEALPPSPAVYNAARALLTPFLGDEFFTLDERGLIKISVHWKKRHGFSLPA